MPTAPQPRSAPVLSKPVALKLKKHLIVMHEGRVARIRAICGASAICLQYLGTEQTAWASADALSGFVDLPETPSTIAESPMSHEVDMERATLWAAAFVPLGDSDVLDAFHRNQIADAMGVHTRTVERHFQAYRQDASPAGQLPARPGPDKGASYLPTPIHEIIIKAIEKKYETPQRGSIASVVREAGRLCSAAGLEPPSRTAVIERLRARNRLNAERKRHGRVRGNALVGPAGESFDITRPLQFVQMDHAICDVIVVDEETREEIGRPWITLAIDIFTRCILGFYLTFDCPSQAGVALALEHACCPKDAWLKSIEYEGEWIPMGMMEAIGWDNAKCFRATGLVSACKHIGIKPLFRWVKTPTHGAHIERFIGTFMGALHLIPGTTFSNSKQKEDYRSQHTAVMTLSELTLWIVHQINGVYHNTKHSSLGMTPLQAWKKVWQRDGEVVIPTIPADRRTFRLSLMPGTYRRIGREGISRFNIKYWGDSLIPLIYDGNAYWVAHDPRDISRVYIRIGDKYFDAPWRDHTRRPISLMELKVIKRRMAKDPTRGTDEGEVFRALNAQHAIEQTAKKTTREQRRLAASRPKDDRQSLQPSRVDYSLAPRLEADPLDAAV